MPKVRVRVSSKGQITLPRAIRECLNVQKGSTLEIEMEDGEAILRPVEGGFMRHSGKFKATKPIDWDRLREEVAEDVARRVMERSG